MKLGIEKWIEEATPLSETGKVLFEEAIICYKNSAYRSAYLMTYLAFMITIKDRILKYEKCPNDINVKYWEIVLGDLNDEQKWEETVLNILQVPSNEMNFLLCGGKLSIKDFGTWVKNSDKDDLKSDWEKAKEKLDQEIVDFDKERRYTIEFRDVKFIGNEKKESKNRRKADIFEVTTNEPDFAKQLAYYRTLRNQCAHGKTIAMEFSASYVESLWLFMKNYLPRLRVGGSIDYWKEKIVNCYLFYKDDLSLYDSFFSELKSCFFSDDILYELWDELLRKMKISFDSWEGEIVGDFEFLRYIFDNEWCRNSFLKYIMDEFVSSESICNSQFVLIYAKMKQYIRPYIKEDTTFWKGRFYDKLCVAFQKTLESFDYLFELWFDLVEDLNGNKEKQRALISSLPLKSLAQMEYKKHINELEKVGYFYIMYKEVRLHNCISSDYISFANYWRTDTDVKIWFWDNVLGAMKDRNDDIARIYKAEVIVFLQQVRSASVNSPEYYFQKEAADIIINRIESGKYRNIEEYWNEATKPVDGDVGGDER